MLELKKSPNKLSGDHATVLSILESGGCFGANLGSSGSTSGSSGLHQRCWSSPPSPLGYLRTGPRRLWRTLFVCDGVVAGERDLAMEEGKLELLVFLAGGTNSSSSSSSLERGGKASRLGGWVAGWLQY